jgi:hypothetical protein
MVNQNKIVAFLLCSSLLLTSCATNGDQPSNARTGAVVGCLLGLAIGLAVAKDKAAGAAIGCAGGGLAGLAVGATLDEHEKRQLAEASVRAGDAPKGQKILWGDTFEAAPPPASSTAEPPASGWVMPATDAVVTADGKECRQLERHADKVGKVYDDQIQVCKVNGVWVASS